jgi:hypothetical protein
LITKKESIRKHYQTSFIQEFTTVSDKTHIQSVAYQPNLPSIITECSDFSENFDQFNQCVALLSQSKYSYEPFLKNVLTTRRVLIQQVIHTLSLPQITLPQPLLKIQIHLFEGKLVINLAFSLSRDFDLDLYTTQTCSSLLAQLEPSDDPITLQSCHAELIEVLRREIANPINHVCFIPSIAISLFLSSLSVSVSVCLSL